jgi:hypothetical protein
MALTQIDDRGLKTPIDLLDNEKIRLGTGNDLEIYHDGSHSRIVDSGTGNLMLQSDRLVITDAGNSENQLVCQSDGALELYYNGFKSFNTSSDGVQIYGPEGSDGNIYLYADEGDDNADRWSIQAKTDGTFAIRNGASWDYAIKAVGDGAVELYHNNFKSFQTDSHGIVVYSPEGSSANVYIYADEGDDNADKWRLQSSSNGSFYIDNYTSGSWENSLSATGNGAVELYYDNAKKLETQVNGVNITSASNDAELKIISTNQDGAALIRFASDDGDDNADYWRIRSDGGGTALSIQNYADAAWETNIECNESGNVELYYDNTKRFETNNSGAHCTGSLTADTVAVQDNEKFLAGNNDDLKIYHDGSNSFIENDTGELFISASQVNIKSAAGEYMAYFNDNAESALYYDDSKKFETLAGGAKVTNSAAATAEFGIQAISGQNAELWLLSDAGNQYGDKVRLLQDDGVLSTQFNTAADTWENAIKCTVNAGVELYYDNTAKLETRSGDVLIKDNLRLQDASKVLVGTGDDIQIYHESGVNKWKNQGSTVFNMVDTGGDKQIEASNNGAVELYHNGSGKIITTSSGVTVTGSVTESSDIALKTDIEPINNVLDKIQQITGYTYKFKDTGHDSIGVTAQDVEKVFPELVHGEEGTKSLQYSGLIGALIESVKELSTKVAALEAA